MLHFLLAAMTLSSPDVRFGAPIPSAFVWNKDGCAGGNRAPRLRWSSPPAKTRAFALTVTDPDVPKRGGWVHWLAFDIPGDARALDHGTPREVIDGRNDFGTFGWAGPCPPPGPPHHYVFRLEALDFAPHLTRVTTLEGYHARVRGHVLGSALLVPVYGR